MPQDDQRFQHVCWCVASKVVCYAAIVGMFSLSDVLPMQSYPYGSFVSVAVRISALHNLFVSTDLFFYMKSVVYWG